MAGGQRRSGNAAQVLILRSRGQAAISLTLSPLRLLLGFVGIALCPAFCVGFAAGQTGLATSSVGRVPALRASSFIQGIYAAHIRAHYEIFGRSRPEPLPPPPSAPASAPAVEELLGEMEFQTPEERRGVLRVHSLHFAENISVRPFDRRGRPDDEAFAAISHLWRCRVTSHELPTNQQLVRLLTTLNDLYDRPIHLISGHRMPDTLGTRETSQHAAGTAADIRVPGVSIEELRAVVTELGARGVGLYKHKGFVHVDFRDKPRYFWVYPEVPDDGEDNGDDARLASTNVSAPGHRTM